MRASACLYDTPRQPCQTEVFHLPGFRHHRTQPFHAELHVESPTGDADAHACVLLVQLRLQLRYFVQRSGITSTEILFAPSLERFLMIASRCCKALIFDMHDMPLQALAVYLRSWSDPVKYLDYDQAFRDFIETVQLLGLAFCDDVVVVSCSN